MYAEIVNFFKQKTAYVIPKRDWSSDVCSSDLMTLGEAAAYYEETPPRGEFVLVVAGAEEKADEGCTFEAAHDLVRARMAEGLSTKDAVKQVAKLTGFAKNLLYDAVVK